MDSKWGQVSTLNITGPLDGFCLCVLRPVGILTRFHGTSVAFACSVTREAYNVSKRFAEVLVGFYVESGSFVVKDDVESSQSIVAENSIGVFLL